MDVGSPVSATDFEVVRYGVMQNKVGTVKEDAVKDNCSPSDSFSYKQSEIDDCGMGRERFS